MKNGRAKGKIAEREVAKMLEAWWGQLEPGCRFKSTPLSGGWSSPDVREAFKTSGDLVTTATRFPFAIEVKRRENWSWETLRAGKPSPVLGWWKQAARQAEEMKSQPLLVFRHNNEPWWAAGSSEYFCSSSGCLVSSGHSFEFGIGLLYVYAFPFASLLKVLPDHFATTRKTHVLEIP
jgi:hypothetical protein